MVRKKGKHSWLIEIYLGRDEEGKRNYYRETFHAPIKSLVVERENELKKQLKRSAGPKREITNLGQYFDSWLEDIRDSITDVTLRGYKKHVKELKPVVGHLLLWDLNAESLKKAISGKFDHLQLRTRKNINDTLRTTIRNAIELKYVPQDALLGFKPIKVPKKSRLVLNREEMLRLISALMTYKHGLILQLLIVTGARLGEIMGLIWEAVDFNRNTITIDQAVDTQKRRPKEDVKNSNSRRTIILDQHMMDLISLHQKQLAKETVRPIQKDRSLVFQAPDGRPVKYNAVRYTFKAALKKAGLPDMRIHDLRHSVITLLLNEGVPAITVATLVGQDVNTTNAKYAQKTRVGRCIEL